MGAAHRKCTRVGPNCRDLAIGNWDVSSLTGKERELVCEAQQHRFDVVGISSTKRRGSGTVDLNGGWKIFYSGVDAAMSAQFGVGLLVSPNIAECVVDWVPLGGRVCLLKLKLQERSLCILQVYAPNIESQYEAFLEEIEVALGKATSKESLVFLGTNSHSYIESLPKSFFCKPCTEKEVYLELMKLNEKNAVGIENIPIKFLKMTAECTSLLLSKIFNKCISKGVFPSKLKIAKVTPLHQSGYSYKSANYRPLSILSPLSKVFEKIIYHRLNNYFITQNTLAKQQFGFRAKHSTSHVISDVINKLQNLRDNHHTSCLILLDLSKTFNTVNHSILLDKLEKYNIRGNSLKLIENYLSNRKQIVNLNRAYSTELKITCGVPQGSILGPLLFSI